MRSRFPLASFVFSECGNSIPILQEKKEGKSRVRDRPAEVVIYYLLTELEVGHG